MRLGLHTFTTSSQVPGRYAKTAYEAQAAQGLLYYLGKPVREIPQVGSYLELHWIYRRLFEQ